MEKDVANDSVLEDDNKSLKLRIKKEVEEWIECIAIAITVALFLILFIVKVSEVDGTSMEPTLFNGEKILVAPLFYNIEQGDIIVCEKNVDGKDEYIVKRVVALEGQTVDIDEDNQVVLVDGEVLDEPYTPSPTYFASTEERTDFPLTLSEGEYFVLGDHREVSLDSRYSEIGIVDESELFGEVIFRFYPVNKMGKVE